MADKKKKFGSFRRKKSLTDDVGHLRPLIPQLQLDCVAYLEKRALRVEGILRISGSNLTIKELQKQYEKGKDPNLEEIDNVHTVACLLKNHFRDSSEPLLTFERYDDFVNTIKLEAGDRLLFVKALIGQLPDSNQEQLHQLLGFLNKVGKYSLENKMDLGNLATMFGPNLMRGANQSPTDILRDMQGIRMVMLLLLQHRYEIFPDWPDEQLIKPDRIKAFRLMEIALNKDQLDIDKELMLMEIESGYRLEKSNRYGSLVKVGSHGKSMEVKAGIVAAQSMEPFGEEKDPGDKEEKEEKGKDKDKEREKERGKEKEKGKGKEKGKEKDREKEKEKGKEKGREKGKEKGKVKEKAESKDTGNDSDKLAYDLGMVAPDDTVAERERAKERFKERSNRSTSDGGLEEVSEILIRDRSQRRRRKKTASNPTGARKGVRRVASVDRHEFSKVVVPERGEETEERRARPSKSKSKDSSPVCSPGRVVERQTSEAQRSSTPPVEAQPSRSNSAPHADEKIEKTLSPRHDPDSQSTSPTRSPSRSPRKKKRRGRSESTKKRRSAAVSQPSNHEDAEKLELAVSDLLEKNQKIKKQLMKQLSPRAQKPPGKKK